MTDKPNRQDGYYGCSLPPGACGCPQDARHRCASAHWIATSPTRDDAEGAGDDAALARENHWRMLEGRDPVPPKPAPSWPQDTPPLRTELLGSDGMGSVSEADLKRAYGVDQPAPDAMREEAKRLLGRAKIQSYPPKILDDCIAFLMRFLSAPVPPNAESRDWLRKGYEAALALANPPVRGGREAIARALAITMHGDDVEWRGFLTKADTFITFLPVQPGAPRLPQDTLDRLANAGASAEEIKDALVKAYAFYRWKAKLEDLPDDMKDDCYGFAGSIQSGENSDR